MPTADLLAMGELQDNNGSSHPSSPSGAIQSKRSQSAERHARCTVDAVDREIEGLLLLAEEGLTLLSRRCDGGVRDEVSWTYIGEPHHTSPGVFHFCIFPNMWQLLLFRSFSWSRLEGGGVIGGTGRVTGCGP